MTSEYTRPTDLYSKIGVKTVIHMTGTSTRYGGTILRPEAKAAMDEASRGLVELGELNEKAGQVLADKVGAEAGMVTSGAAGALLLQAAAVIAGTDPASIARLPDTDGMKNEIVMQRVHRMGYDQCYRAAGAKIIDIGQGSTTQPQELEAAITDKTAAVAFIVSPGNGGRGLKLDNVLDIAHSHNVPVLVDAASMLPPRENLFKFIRSGADMVCYSGGKGIRGPQGTGLLLGRRDLIDAALANGAPNAAIGRSGKVAKEEIMGLLAALDAFLDGDEEAEMDEYRIKCEEFLDRLAEVPDITFRIEHDDFVHLIPTAVVKFDRSWRGRSSEKIVEALAQGDPPIYCQAEPVGEGIVFNPFNPSHEEMRIAGDRVRQELLKQ